MHLIKLTEVNQSEKSLTQAILQISQMLGIYNAELASLLGLRCSDIADFSASKKTLRINTLVWKRGELLVSLFECLYAHCQGAEACMHNWLRREHAGLQATPLYLMVDEKKIESVFDALKNANK